MKRHALTFLQVTTLLLTAVASAPTRAAERPPDDVDALLEHRWYRTEIIVFERTRDEAGGGAASRVDAERTVVDSAHGLRRYPPRMHAMGRSAEEESQRYPIDPRPPLPGDLPLTFSRPPLIEPPEPVEASGALEAPPDVSPEVLIDPLEPVRMLVKAQERSWYEQSYQWLPEASLELGQQARRLNRRRGLSVLYHGAWLQPVPPRDQPLPVLFQEGPRIGPVFELEGTLTVTVGRYLHCHVKLWLHRPTLGLEPMDQLWNPDPLDNGFVAEPMALRAAALRRPYIELNERRRMRSGELHYFDHPNMGVLVKIFPVEIPESLIEAFEQATAEDEAPAPTPVPSSS